MSSREKLKIVGVNVIVLCVLLTAPAVGLHFYRKLKVFYLSYSERSVDPRAEYPVYSDLEKSKTLFDELTRHGVRYQSFIGWRRKPASYTLTNVVGPYGTRNSRGHSLDSSVWFFGGSTIWGTGASDMGTIPSHFSFLTGHKVLNLGESGWGSRQSLNQFMNLLSDGHTPTAVVFYDGVNEVINQCRSDSKIVPSYGYDENLNSALLGNPFEASLRSVLKFVSYPFLKFASFRVGSGAKGFDCDSNDVKASLVAKHLVDNWEYAYMISERKGITFKGILQPTYFSSGIQEDYFVAAEGAYQDDVRPQFEAVYPRVMREMKMKCLVNKGFCDSLVDGTGWLYKVSGVFLDFCHVTSKGNRVVAKELVKNL